MRSFRILSFSPRLSLTINHPTMMQVRVIQPREERWWSGREPSKLADAISLSRLGTTLFPTTVRVWHTHTHPRPPMQLLHLCNLKGPSCQHVSTTKVPRASAASNNHGPPDREWKWMWKEEKKNQNQTAFPNQDCTSEVHRLLTPGNLFILCR